MKQHISHIILSAHYGIFAMFSCLMVLIVCLCSSSLVHAQSGYDPNYQGRPSSQGQPNGYQSNGYQQDPRNNPNLSQRDRRCLALERQLASDWIMRSQSQDNLPRLEEEIRRWDSEFHMAQSQAEEADCYEDMFFFGRSLKRTQRCIRLNQRAEDAKQRLADLQRQRDSIASRRSTRESDIIEELARNGCGENYVRENEKRNPGLFNWGGGNGLFGGGTDEQNNDQLAAKPPSQIMPYATYRTMCVRKCDGFYFPLSFSTLPNRFEQDAAACQNNCAAPAELFVYKNPGEEPEQMIALNGQPYSQIPNAFRFRKEFLTGCSCKQAEYKPELFSNGEKTASTKPPSATQNQNMLNTQQEMQNPEAPFSEQNPQESEEAPQDENAQGEQAPTQYNPFN